MDKNQAKELLSFHSTRNSNINHIKWEKGFIGCLRPYQGELYLENFYEVMNCMKILKDELISPMIDQEIVTDIVTIIHTARVWASPRGMLGRNNLLTVEQAKHLFAWVDIIEGCFMFLLEGDTASAFTDYQDYLKGNYIL